jgi:RNA polymerase sigma-70 factor (ECF subfamily)
MDINRLIERCRTGDPEAVGDFVSSYQEGICRLAGSILTDPFEIDEAVQETFVAALRNLDGYRKDATLKTWLYAICVNVCRAKLRKQRADNRLHNVLHTLGMHARIREKNVEEMIIRREKNEAVVQAVRSLEENLRLPIILRYGHNLSIHEIAQILKISQRSVHVRLKKAHLRLRDVLAE